MPAKLLDLCCGGHDHDYIRDEKHRVVKAGQEWRYLVDIEFELPPAGKKGAAKLVKCEKVPIGEVLADGKRDDPPDPEIAELVAKWEAMVQDKASKVLGKTDVDLNSTEARPSPPFSRPLSAPCLVLPFSVLTSSHPSSNL